MLAATRRASSRVSRPLRELTEHALQKKSPATRRASAAVFVTYSYGNTPRFGYARVSTDGQTLASQDAELMAAGCAKVYQEKVSGARTDRAELAKVMKRLERDDLLIVTRLDRLARSTRDLLNILRTAISRSLTRSLRRTIQAG
jgi:hypothetical protein